MTAQTTHADLWTASADSAESEEVYAARWELVRLIREAGGEQIPPEVVATWRPRPTHYIGLAEIVRGSISSEKSC